MGKVKSQLTDNLIVGLLFSDLGRIQTCNRLSRNQVFYSVELRGQLMPQK